jgi:hypothetical protein
MADIELMIDSTIRIDYFRQDRQEQLSISKLFQRIR